MRIVNSTNRRAVANLLSATRIRDRATDVRAAVIVDRVRKGGDPALLKFARELDGLRGGIEVPRRLWEAQARTLAPNATNFFTSSGACGDFGRLVRAMCRA